LKPEENGLKNITINDSKLCHPRFRCKRDWILLIFSELLLIVLVMKLEFQPHPQSTGNSKGTWSDKYKSFMIRFHSPEFVNEKKKKKKKS
jgi:hypothetical protein